MRRLQGIAPRAALSGYKEATMGKRGEKRERRSAILEPDAAGIDIGAEEIYVAVPPDRDEQATRRFSSFTCDLYALAEWLEGCRIRTVAMESTGSLCFRFWKSVASRYRKCILETCGSR